MTRFTIVPTSSEVAYIDGNARVRTVFVGDLTPKDFYDLIRRCKETGVVVNVA